MKKEINVRNVLIVLTFISLIITFLNFTYLTYQERNIDLINNFLVNYVNNAFLFIDNFLVIIFGIIYIVLGIKSKKEVLLKVSFRDATDLYGFISYNPTLTIKVPTKYVKKIE